MKNKILIWTLLILSCSIYGQKIEFLIDTIYTGMDRYSIIEASTIYNENEIVSIEEDSIRVTKKKIEMDLSNAKRNFDTFFNNDVQVLRE